MEHIEIVLHSTDELMDASARLLDFAGSARVFLFEGEMGSGKTTFIKAISKQLGSIDHFSSPTFSLVNEYDSPKGKIYHLDLYRVRQAEELLDIGIEEMLDSGHYCFIEWPEQIKDLIETPAVVVRMSVAENQRLVRAFHFKSSN